MSETSRSPLRFVLAGTGALSRSNHTLFRCLVENLELNRVSNVTPLNLAAGNKSGTLSFSDSKYDDTNRVDPEGLVCVGARRLDEIPEITDATKIDLLKIDVEGYELSVLYGATEVLARTKLVYFESYQENCAPFGTSTADVTDSLYDAGFYVVKAETRTPINRGHVSMNLENLLGINPALQHYTKGSAG